MWEQRNEALHHSTTNCMIILESLVNDKIQYFYALGSAALPCHAMHLIQMLLEELSKPITTKSLWVESIKVAILRKVRHTMV